MERMLRTGITFGRAIVLTSLRVASTITKGSRGMALTVERAHGAPGQAWCEGMEVKPCPLETRFGTQRVKVPPGKARRASRKRVLRGAG